MKNKIIASFLLLTLLSNCQNSAIGKALRNEKTTTTDEFLIKKNEPLIEPPNFESLPEPDSAIKSEKEPNEIDKLFKTTQRNSNIEKNTSSEKSILNKIRQKE